MYLDKFKVVQNNRPFLNKTRKEMDKIEITSGGKTTKGIATRVRAVFSRKWTGSIIFNIQIFWTCLKQGVLSCSTKLDGIKVHLKEQLKSVHTKIFEAWYIMLIQKISECFGRFEFLDHFVLGLTWRRSKFFCFASADGPDECHFTQFPSLIPLLNSSTPLPQLPTVRISALKSYCMMLCMLLCMKLCMT